LTNLLVFLEEVTNYIDSGYPVDVIYLDFQKAFDKVTHGRLVSMLDAHGIGGEILKWVENWLSERKQRVVLGGEFSEWRDILSGVPQGRTDGQTSCHGIVRAMHMRRAVKITFNHSKHFITLLNYHNTLFFQL